LSITLSEIDIERVTPKPKPLRRADGPTDELQEYGRDKEILR
jgi:hypothetical protein